METQHAPTKSLSWVFVLIVAGCVVAGWRIASRNSNPSPVTRPFALRDVFAIPPAGAETAASPSTAASPRERATPSGDGPAPRVASKPAEPPPASPSAHLTEQPKPTPAPPAAPVEKPTQIGPLTALAAGVEHGSAGSFTIVIKAQNAGKDAAVGQASFSLRVGDKKDAGWETPVDLAPGAEKNWRLQTSLELEGAVTLAIRFTPAKGKASAGELRVTVPADIVAAVKKRKADRAARFIEVKVQAVKQGNGFFRYYIGAWNLTNLPVKGKLTVGKYLVLSVNPQGAGAHTKERRLDLAAKGFNQGYVDWSTGPPCKHGEAGVVSLGWEFESSDGKKCTGNWPVPNKITDVLTPDVEMAD